jgi:glycerophosphoryl diester phosphodiesterase
MPGMNQTAAGPAVEVVAHRGSPGRTPEHSLAAYRQAVSLGVSTIECDVRMTRDEALVCVHDRRIHRVSTGRGTVSALTLAELERFTFHARATRGWRRRPPGRLGGTELPGGEVVEHDAAGVLTLDRLLDYVTSRPGMVRLAIETKHPTRHSGRVEEALVRALRRFGLVSARRAEPARAAPVRAMSFSRLALRRLQALEPALPVVQLISRLAPRGGGALPQDIPAVGPPISLLRRYPRYVALAHAAGKEVHVWTVNDERDIDLALSLGVDAVITDRPRDVLRRAGAAVPGGGAAQPASARGPYPVGGAAPRPDQPGAVPSGPAVLGGSASMSTDASSPSVPGRWSPTS